MCDRRSVFLCLFLSVFLFLILRGLVFCFCLGYFFKVQFSCFVFQMDSSGCFKNLCDGPAFSPEKRVSFLANIFFCSSISLFRNSQHMLDGNLFQDSERNWIGMVWDDMRWIPSNVLKAPSFSHVTFPSWEPPVFVGRPCLSLPSWHGSSTTFKDQCKFHLFFCLWGLVFLKPGQSSKAVTFY